MRTLGRPRDRVEILGRLRDVRPDSAGRWGRMSAHGMVCHLGDALRMGLGDRRVTPASGPLRRTVLKWIALYAPLPWPRGFRTSPEIDQEASGTEPAEFTADVARVEALIEAFTAPGGRLDRRVHPVFGGMSEAAWLRWGYLHMDHHLRQFGIGRRTRRPR